MGADIYKSAAAFSRSYPIDILGFRIPHMWAYLAATCLLQYMFSFLTTLFHICIYCDLNPETFEKKIFCLVFI